MNLLRVSLASATIAGALAAQTPCPQALPIPTAPPVDLNAATGTGLNYGVQVLPGVVPNEVFVTGAQTATGPFEVYVLDLSGALLRTFAQPAGAQPSAEGLLDGATDGANLFFGNENGIFAFDRNGNAVTTINAANGPQSPTFPITGPALATLGSYRALAFDRTGNAGNGSFFAGNQGSDIVEIDLAGNVLRTFTNGGQWSAEGLALTDGQFFKAAALWVSSDASGSLVALDLTTGAPTGVTMPIGLAGAGGLSLGADFDVLSIDRDATDRLLSVELPTFVSQPRQMLTGADGMLDPTLTTVTTLNSTFGWDLDAPVGTPYAYIWNVFPESTLCGSFFQFFLRGDQLAFGGVRAFESITDFTIPTSIVYLLEPAAAGTPVQGPALAALGNIPDGLMRVQAVYADFTGPGLINPIRITPPAYLSLDSTPLNGVSVIADGVNSFNQDTTRGFFQISSISPNPMKAITSVTFDFTVNLSGMEFDTDQTGMLDIFENGNSTAVNCEGTYRNGSDVLTGLVYSGANTMPATPCNGGALTGFLGTNPTLVDSWQTLRFEFNQGTFFNGAVFEFDADTDGGGVNGAAMDGLVVTVTFVDGTSATGTMQAVLGTDRAQADL